MKSLISATLMAAVLTLAGGCRPSVSYQCYEAMQRDSTMAEIKVATMKGLRLSGEADRHRLEKTVARVNQASPDIILIKGCVRYSSGAHWQSVWPLTELEAEVFADLDSTGLRHPSDGIVESLLKSTGKVTVLEEGRSAICKGLEITNKSISPYEKIM